MLLSLRGLRARKGNLTCPKCSAVRTATWVIRSSRLYSDGDVHGGKKYSKGHMENSIGRIARLASKVLEKLLLSIAENYIEFEPLKNSSWQVTEDKLHW